MAISITPAQERAAALVGQTFLSAKRRQTGMSAPRAGMTLVEITVALAIVGVLAVIVAQCVAWSLREGSRLSAHQAAVELADNVLEGARAQPWDSLDQAWADKQSVPAVMADLLPDGKVIVTVNSEGAGARRVSVAVTWQDHANAPPQRVELTTVLSGREAKKEGATP